MSRRAPHTLQNALRVAYYDGDPADLAAAAARILNVPAGNPVRARVVCESGRVLITIAAPEPTPR